MTSIDWFNRQKPRPPSLMPGSFGLEKWQISGPVETEGVPYEQPSYTPYPPELEDKKRLWDYPPFEKSAQSPSSPFSPSFPSSPYRSSPFRSSSPLSPFSRERRMRYRMGRSPTASSPSEEEDVFQDAPTGEEDDVFYDAEGGRRRSRRRSSSRRRRHSSRRRYSRRRRYSSRRRYSRRRH